MGHVLLGMDDYCVYTLYITTNLCQLPVLSFIWATCCMKKVIIRSLKKTQNNICLISGLFLWKAAPHSEWKVRTTTDGSYCPTQVVQSEQTTRDHHCAVDSHGEHLDYVHGLTQFLMKQHLCPPLRGCCQRRCWLQCLPGRCGLRSPLRPHGHCRRTDRPERGHCTLLSWNNTVG